MTNVQSEKKVQIIKRLKLNNKKALPKTLIERLFVEIIDQIALSNTLRSLILSFVT